MIKNDLLKKRTRMDSLCDVIKNEDNSWLNFIFKRADVPELISELKITTSKNRKAIIKARIENINQL